MRMDLQQTKAAVLDRIDQRAGEALDAAKRILDNPESGFREQRTSRFVAEKLCELGIPSEGGLALTGVKGMLHAAASGPTVGVFGELDSLIVPDHPFADPQTGAAHACGHHTQIGSLLAVAIGLQAPNVLENLAGRVALLAVPSEEFIEIEYRDGLRREGRIEFLGGKSEFVELGVMDDVDIAMMTHTENQDWGYSGAKIGVGASNNGMVAKRIRFEGVASHAGGSPHLGVNALNAANIALTAIHAQRETFLDDDSIRIHPIITKGGTVVSSVPADVRMETFVRGAAIEAYTAAAQKVDRALRAGAMAVGGSVNITTIPGYAPLSQDAALTELYVSNAAALLGADGIARMGRRTGSTDMGDISQIMPAIHPYAAAATGKAHGNDYVVQDYDLAVITAGKAMAMTIVDLLYDGAQQAQSIIRDFDAGMSKQQYLARLRATYSEETYAG